jgi:hypothetical protein
MNRLTRMTLQIFVIAVTTLTASHWKGDSENAGAAQAQTSSGNVAQGENTLGADQANKASNTGVAVPESQADITTRPGLAPIVPGTALAANAGTASEAENTLGADQANKVSNTGVDVSGTQAGVIARPGFAAGPDLAARPSIAANAGETLIDLEGADPQSERNFSFDAEKDPAAASGP